MIKNDITININCSENSIIMRLFEGDQIVKEYIFESNYKLSKIGSRLCVITMLRWSICENLNSNFYIENFEPTEKEVAYLNSEVGLLIDFMTERIGDSARKYTPTISYQAMEKVILEDPRYITDKISLGFSEGKDSICCQILLEKAGYEIEKFRFDFDESEFINDFYTKSIIVNENISKKIATQSIFFKNNIPYYQEEDMHVIYLAPILLSAHKGYYTKMCCGIQWDMLSLEGKSITIAESFASMKHLISLVREVGFSEFGIILPLSTISSFGVYRILADEFGFLKLDNFNSCWVSDVPCGQCLKCKRVKFTQDILEACISEKFDEILDIINCNRISIDYLFGSQNIYDLISSLNRSNIRDISKDLYISDLDPEFDECFSTIIEREYSFKRLSKL
ncbi:hypothetical protein [Facklamia hominis]|uniref:hypothetical protein n=1 Tax=Facklamia hominis TaxID=178214 RepID=UPI0038FCE74A